MYDCTISINAPKRFLKGAGIPNTKFVPAWVYKTSINLKNKGKTSKLCSFSVALGNGIRYADALDVTGPDTSISNAINVVKPKLEVGNNNVIIYANNFMLSPNSENIITFDTALCDRYTENCIENSGDKIPHESKINFNGHLIYGEFVDSCRFISEAADYELSISCEDDTISLNNETKYYIQCKVGQYDMVRSVYLRSILDEGLEFIPDSSNLEPKNVYTFDQKTILKWDVGSLQPCEVKRIGYKVNLRGNNSIDKGDIIKNKSNSNCINNSTYTQCPSSCDYNLVVE
jgi:hypothetical protein